MVYGETVEERAAGALAAPADAEVRAQLRLVRSSPDFDVPERARNLLAYVIEEAIAGRADRIKAYSIATEVFGRDSSFEAHADPIVRIEAGRVRRALERYYLTAGQNDPIVITIPKGAYVPTFARRDQTLPPQGGDVSVAAAAAMPERLQFPPMAVLAIVALLLVLVGATTAEWVMRLPSRATVGAQGSRQAAPDVPKLIVQSFEDLSRTGNSALIAKGLTEEIVGQLARFKEIIVTTEHSPLPGGATLSSQPARYALQGGVRLGRNKLRLTVWLVNRNDSSVVWSGIYDEDLNVRELLEFETEVAQAVATALAQPYGIIFQADGTQMAQSAPDDWEAYACTLAYYGYRTSLSPQTHAAVQACLQKAVDRYPNYATAWALLSLTYLDQLRFRYRLNAPSSPPLELAAEAARRAVELDPQNVRGLQAEMLAFYFRGDVDTALVEGARALLINPNDTELLGEYGFRLALSGEWERGCGLITEAMERNPGQVGYFEASLALCAYMQRDFAAAEKWANSANLQPNPIYHIILTAILGKLGKRAEAQRELKWLEDNAPEFLRNIRGEVAMRIRREEDQAFFLEGLREAGL